MGLGFARALSGLGSYLGSTIQIMMKTGSLAKLILITLPCPNVGLPSGHCCEHGHVHADQVGTESNSGIS